MSREWAVRHVFEHPPSPVVMRSDTEEQARFSQSLCAKRDDPCVVVHRDSPDAEWVSE